MERRRERSKDRAVAAQYYLKALAGRRSYRAVALADQDGLLLANVGERGEAMAAVAPLWDEDAALRARFSSRVHGNLRAWSLDLDGSPCYLATLDGDDTPPREAQEALTRILLAA